MAFQTTITKEEAVTVVHLTGKLSTDTAPAFSKAMQALDYDGMDLTLDFSGLDYITSAGLRVLLIVRKKLSEDRIRIVHMNDAVREVFELSGFSSFIPIVSEESASLPELPSDPSFRQVLSYRVKTDPDREIFFADDTAFTWRDVDRGSQIIASDLARLGVRKGTHVGVFAHNTLNWVCTFFAIQKLGAVIVLLNYGLKPAELITYSGIGDITHLCYDSRSAKMDGASFAAAVTGAGSNIRAVYDISPAVDFRARYDELGALEGLYTEEYNPDDPCVMIFTSGTTGLPKGVLSSSHDRITNCRIMARQLRVSDDDRICLFLPLCHVFGFGTGLSVALLYNIPMIMPSSISDASLLDAIHRYRCTIFNSVPTKILSMAHNELFSPEKVASLRASMIGGAAITRSQLLFLREKMPGLHLLPIYGMSEISPISMMLYEDTIDHITDTVGRPVDEVEVEIRDIVTGECCPAGVQGEICVRSDTSLICYYKLDIEKQAIDAEGWIPTGDLGFLDADGYLRLTGRCKDLIIRGGENISPKEIEEAITQLEEIQDVKVVGVPDEHFGEIVAAAVMCKPGISFSRERVENHILKRLAAFKAPAYYVLYDAFPLLSNGKVNMLKLRKEVAEKAGSEEAL